MKIQDIKPTKDQLQLYILDLINDYFLTNESKIRLKHLLRDSPYLTNEFLQDEIKTILNQNE